MTSNFHDIEFTKKYLSPCDQIVLLALDMDTALLFDNSNDKNDENWGLNSYFLILGFDLLEFVMGQTLT